MLKALRQVLAVIILVGFGFFAAKISENDKIASFLEFSLPYVIGFIISTLVFLTILVWLTLWIVRRIIFRRLRVHREQSIDEMIPAVVNRLVFGDPGPAALSEDRNRAFFVNLGLWLARREAIQLQFSIIIAVGGSVVGLATLFLLSEQNQKLQIQNEKISIQTDANVVQTLLLEGSRRAGLSNRLDVMLSDISHSASEDKPACNERHERNCWSPINQPGSAAVIFSLPADLRLRLMTLVSQSTPYHIPSFESGRVSYEDNLSNQANLRFVSPERGLILQVLGQNRVVVPSSNYSHADLSYSVFDDLFFDNLFAPDADLSGSRSSRLRLNFANLNGAIFQNASIDWAVFHRAKINSSDFTGAHILNSNFTEAEGVESKFGEANLAGADFSGSKLDETDFTNANIKDAQFMQASLIDANFSNSYISLSTFAGSDITRANFRETEFADAPDFTGAMVLNGDSNLPIGLPFGLELLRCRDISYSNIENKPVGVDCSLHVLQSEAN